MRAICIGNSHLGVLISASLAAAQALENHPFDIAFVLPHLAAFQPTLTYDAAGSKLNPVLTSAVNDARAATESAELFSVVSFAGAITNPERQAIYSLIGGNAHNVLGLLVHEQPFDFVLSEEPTLPLMEGARIVPEAEILSVLASSLKLEVGDTLRALRAATDLPVFHMESTPPIASNAHIEANLDPFFGAYASKTISPPSLRYKLWRLHSRAMRDICQNLGIEFIPCPPASQDEGGFLLPEYTPDNATHANVDYGKLMLGQIQESLADEARPKQAIGFSPYAFVGKSAFWREAVADVAPDAIAPMIDAPFRIKASDKVATAGSCFAQHIARHLQRTGFNYLVAERGHPMLPDALQAQFNYGVFSARYGNIYTSRQLLQLFQRCEGEFDPVDRVWTTASGDGFVDPYRPAIQSRPFESIRELEADRAVHLAAVSAMMRELDVFVFTLGLTECYMHRADGAVYPMCPGTSGGVFDSRRHVFLNLSVSDVVKDLTEAFSILRKVNPQSRIILTVSPVPLKATASGEHVLTATSYSKSVLRAAADEVAKSVPRTVYFPSYEIITGAFNRGAYFEKDLRGVKPEGVEHVMRVFQAYLTEANANSAEEELAPADPALAEASKSVAELVCEEDMLEMARMLRNE